MSSVASDLVKKFVAFHAANPDVYELFKRFAFEAIAAGHKTISSDMILHRIRWETDVATKAAGWEPTSKRSLKINNTHSAYYARLFIIDHPGHAALFKLRKARTS